jgi:predicted glycoside hydrolase/deacetylase ChbG (UPF0249 family)
VTDEGFTTTDGALGVLATGTLDATIVNSLLKQMPPGIWELVTHPGYNDQHLAEARTRLRESRDIERVSLQAIRASSGLELISFGDLTAIREPHG